MRGKDGLNPPRWTIRLPLQRALAQVMTRLLSGDIGHKQAGQILYRLQTARLNLKSLNLESAQFPPGKSDGESL
jgi:hypothetical protein